MKTTFFSLLILFCFPIMASAQDDKSIRDTVIDNEHFIIVQYQIDAGCYGNATTTTTELWFGGHMLTIEHDRCTPECAVVISSISFVNIGGFTHVLLVQSEGVLGTYKSYFMKDAGSGTYVRLLI